MAAYLDGSWTPADGPYGAEQPTDDVPAPAAPQDTPQLEGSGSRLPASDIKGRMTLQEVAQGCQAPLD